MSRLFTMMMILALTGLLVTTGCEKEPELPTVTTAEVTDVVQTTAKSGGNVTFDGHVQVTARGVCWSPTPEPTVDGPHSTDGVGTGEFVSQIIGLAPGVTYYVRAYAINSVGTVYGSQKQFTTPL